MSEVFVSHASRDIKLAESLIQLFEGGIGLSPTQIFCSSFDEQGIPGGSDWHKTIKDELRQAKVIVSLVSMNYYSSVYSLCEFGAAWISDKQIIPLLVPPLDYGNLKGPLLTYQALSIADSVKLDTIFDQLSKYVRQRPDAVRWNRKKQAFLAELSSILKPPASVVEGKEDHNVRPFFRGFLDQNAILFHKVRKTVTQIMNHHHPVIPTKYLFAHADSFEYYQRLSRSATYTIIKEGHILFAKESQGIVDRLISFIDSKKPLTVVSLGIGTGETERSLFHYLDARASQLSFLAIDINPAFLQSSLSSLRDEIPGLDSRFLIGDFDELESLTPILPTRNAILVLALGGIFGNQDEKILLEKLRRIQEDVYLLLDCQTVEAFEGADRGGYENSSNKEFIQSGIKNFCHENIDLDRIHACFCSELSEIHCPTLTSVSKARTVVMVGETSGGRKRYVGYSTRYDIHALRDFLSRHGEIMLETKSASRQTYIFLCKLKPLGPDESPTYRGEQ